MRLTHLFNEGSNWHTDPEQQSMDATRRARLGREREPAGGDAIDARLAANNNARQQYAETGHFWLKQKDTQQHLNDQPYTGKAAANAAALELLKQQPELRGNLVVTAYGPGEQQVTEGKVKELGQDLKDKAMSDAEFKKKYSKTRAEVRAAMREKPVAEGFKDPNELSSPNSMRHRLGNIIKQAVNSDNEDQLYSTSPLYQKLWGIYGGDIDAIINGRSIADLQKLARELVTASKQGVAEGVGGLNVGDPVIITGNVQFQGKTGDVKEIGQDGSFVVVDLYNYGPQSFQATDVSYNDYADETGDLDEGEKVGNMDADRFDAAMARLKQLAGAGPVRTVYDPTKRVYRNVPTAQQPGDKK